MPEISEQDFRALQDQVQALANQLNAARNRIQDLEDFATDHIGLDWGESLVDANSPHPNISANTIESGGGVIRQDAHGMQFVSSSEPVEGEEGSALVNFVYELHQTPSAAANKGVIHGYSLASGTTRVYALSKTGDVSAIVKIDTSSGGSSSVQPGINILNNGSSLGPYTYLTGGLYSDSGIFWAGALTPAQITSDQNDYNPTGLTSSVALRLSTDASRNITGLRANDGGRMMMLLNVGSFDVVLKDESLSSVAAFRFALAADITLAPDNAVLLWYDSTSSRWRCVARYT